MHMPFLVQPKTWPAALVTRIFTLRLFGVPFLLLATAQAVRDLQPTDAVRAERGGSVRSGLLHRPAGQETNSAADTDGGAQQRLRRRVRQLPGGGPRPYRLSLRGHQSVRQGKLRTGKVWNSREKKALLACRLQPLNFGDPGPSSSSD